VTVAVDAPQHSGLSEVLTYTASQPVPPGTLVRVPLGRRVVSGVVMPHPPQDDLGDADLRPIEQVIEGLPPMGTAWLQLAQFAARYYQRSLGEVALAALPPELRKLDAPQVLTRLKRLHKAVGPGAAVAQESVGPAELPPLTEEQQRVVQALESAAAPATTLLHGATGSGKTEVYLRAAARAVAQGRQALVLVPEINLTPQLEARFAERFKGHVIATLHSGLTPAQRLRHWLLAHLGVADLVLGTRMAVFASLPRLGLIVVDEEHDPSYKSQDGARYSARDLAVWRGRHEQLPVILGSATPSLETWLHAQQGRYARQDMPARVGGGVLPRVRLVDMNLQPRAVGQSLALSPPLQAALEGRIAKGEQSLVFLNRRGYAPVLFCGDCGWKSGCPNCSAWRVFHKLDRTLRCHHCGYTERVPKACPDCGNLDIAPMGRGTERLEEQLAQALKRPDGSPARIGRIDADSTRHKGELESQLAAVHAGEVDVLVGTQMVTKGHDFRRMTLVAAVNPDGALFSSDFRAAERLFALLMQAAGRAGREASQSAQSEMWVQTWHPTHPLYQALRQYDYSGFAQAQLDERAAASVPPYAHMALLRAEAKTAAAATGFLQAVSQALQDLPEAQALLESVFIYPPVPTPVAKVANVERIQMLLESPSRVALQKLLALAQPLLHELRHGYKGPQGGILRWALDVDPQAI
jgi:primosomal protein N' (replication factor Y)